MSVNDMFTGRFCRWSSLNISSECASRAGLGDKLRDDELEALLRRSITGERSCWGVDALGSDPECCEEDLLQSTTGQYSQVIVYDRTVVPFEDCDSHEGSIIG